MIRFHDDWTFDAGAGPVEVMLPHDAMRDAPRSPTAASRYHGGWFEGVRGTYRKRWIPGAEHEGRRVDLIFEGIQGDATVTVDAEQVASHRDGYGELSVDLTPVVRHGCPLEIAVRIDATALPNGRWYSGAGLYRSVWLRVTHASRFRRDGVWARTISIGDPAVLEVSAEVETAEDDLSVALTLLHAETAEVVARRLVEVRQGSAVARLAVPEPRLWSDVDPALYRCVATLQRGSSELERVEIPVGIRTVEIGPRGLLLNGRRTLLRGGNIHHDHGVLGAATHRAAELRRARILKAAGYNAVRSAHNPASRELLAACDTHGLLVMDELTDVWWQRKTAHDGAERFLDTWEQRLRAMVRKARAHPSVVMYSIGNENGETGTPYGIRLAGEMRDTIRAEDTTRPVTAGVNLGLTAASYRSARRSRHQPVRPEPKSALPPKLDSTAFNVLFSALGPLVDRQLRAASTDEGTKEIFAALDVAGYNYGIPRYEIDLAAYSDRIIVGTETRPGDLAAVWPLVQRHPRLLGDFTWAAWDHIGEAGVGTWLPKRLAGLMKPYPHILSGAGAIDITGLPGAPAFLAQAAWDRDAAPRIAVRPLSMSGKPTAKTAWRNSDAISSWSWDGYEGRRATIEVFSSADEIELLLDGTSIGRAGAGADHGFVARFRTRYQQGTLTAIAWSAGREVGRSQLTSAGPSVLRLSAEDETDDVAFVVVEIADRQGRVNAAANAQVSLAIEGPGALLGFGSASPTATSSYREPSQRLWYGRALAVVRHVSNDGPVTLSATSASGDARIELFTRKA